MTVELNERNFDEIVVKSDKPVLVDFWAEWCGPCRIIGPTVEELAKEFEGKAIVGKVNVDENISVASKYGIRNIPTLLIFKSGQVVDKHVGVASKSVLAEKLNKQL
ncbi:MAG: thioredoxin [Thermaurantimonas sp.]|uniref:thioredoxin n=1 Tax=Thermaurantimonas sp. TaxID=2681568 RepID=UPI00391C859E